VKVLKADEVKVLPRGRKAKVDAELVKTLKTIKTGTFGLMDEEFGVVPAAKRQSVQSEIRKHWTLAHGKDAKVTIRWSPEGYAQVGHAKTD
jgi:hypothetical protein